MNGYKLGILNIFEERALLVNQKCVNPYHERYSEIGLWEAIILEFLLDL